MNCCLTKNSNDLNKSTKDKFIPNTEIKRCRVKNQFEKQDLDLSPEKSRDLNNSLIRNSDTIDNQKNILKIYLDKVNYKIISAEREK